MGFLKRLFSDDGAPAPKPLSQNQQEALAKAAWHEAVKASQATLDARLAKILDDGDWNLVAATLGAVGVPNAVSVIADAKQRQWTPCALACYAIDRIYQSINEIDRAALRERLAKTADAGGPESNTQPAPAQRDSTEDGTPDAGQSNDPSPADSTPDLQPVADNPTSTPATPQVNPPSKPAGADWNAIQAILKGGGPTVAPKAAQDLSPKPQDNFMAAPAPAQVRVDCEAALVSLQFPKARAKDLAATACLQWRPGMDAGKVLALAMQIAKGTPS